MRTTRDTSTSGVRPCALAALAVMILCLPASAGRTTLRYSGELTDSGGQPQNGTFLLHFRLWNEFAGGKEVWRESRYVLAEKGRFIATLGEDSAIPEEALSAAYRLTVEAPPGTGWAAKASRPPEVIQVEAPAAAAPDPGQAGDSVEVPAPSSEELDKLKREVEEAQAEARRAKREAEESRKRLDVIEATLRDGGLPSEESRARIYVVRRGDTLRSIATKLYGSAERWIELYQANHDRIQRGGELTPGQKLLVPVVKR
ncbi:MAG: LysM peptidoglycan-binding domain-containing protein [Elusimicrobiota bacterium]